MKSFLNFNSILVVVILCSFTPLQDTIPWKELKALRKEVKDKYDVRSKYSSGQQLTWFSSKEKSVGSAENFKFYFGFSDNKEIMTTRFKYYYSASNWLFIDELKILIGSRKKNNLRVYEFKVDRDYVERKVLSGGGISETIDMPIPSGLQEFLNDVLAEEKNLPIIVELHGDKYTTGGTWASQWKNSYSSIKKAKKFIEEKYN